MSDSKPNKILSFNDFISGSVAGIVQVLIGQPFDIVKVRLQTQSEMYKSALDCAKNILTKEGPLAFYKGTLSPLIGISFCVAVQFAANGVAKNFLINRNKGEPLTVKQNIVAGMFAGTVNSFVISPVELFRIKMQVQGNETPKKYNGSIDCVKKVFNQHGLRGIYQGLVATLIREIPAYGIYFGLYESLMNRAARQYGGRSQIPLTYVCMYGALSGLGLWMGTFPNDVVKSCLQADDLGSRKYKSYMDAVCKIHREKGIGGFFRGLAPCLIRAPPANAATFLTYEVISDMLNKK